jgi:membrane associated rhomboid family serine protease
MSKFLFDFFSSGAPVTWLLMTAILIFSGISFYSSGFFMKMILHPYSIIREKEYYRLFTADLVHNDLLHLVLNEFMLFVFCARLEVYLKSRTAGGSWQFLFIYLLSYFAGVIITTLKHRNQFKYSSAGASGSIMGCMFSFIILQPDKIAFYIPGLGGIKNLYGGLLYIVMMIINQKRNPDSTTNLELHFYGTLGGVMATLMLFPAIL